MKLRTPAIRLPLLILAAGTALILLFDLDLRVQSRFYTEDQGWWLAHWPPVVFLYRYGTWPALALAGTALLLCLANLGHRRLRRWLPPALFLVLVMGLGPGLVVNAIFKANFGRPRPCQIEQFGQQREFLPLWRKGERKKGASFPSGHASMGFYLMSPYFILLTRKRRLARAALLLGVAAGCAIGAARIAAGGHFIGDVLWSWGFTYLVGLACYPVLRPGRKRRVST
jgi:membrane-associated PAP2 superfamily phosphatase